MYTVYESLEVILIQLMDPATHLRHVAASIGLKNVVDYIQVTVLSRHELGFQLFFSFKLWVPLAANLHCITCR